MTKSPATISPERRQVVSTIVSSIPAIVAAVMLGYAFVAGGYFVTVMSFALIYAIFVTGLNLFMGYAGQVTFGHNAFAALSGYASAVLTATYGFEPIVAFLAGMALAMSCALLIGFPTLRLKGHYLAMGTLAIGLIVYEIAIQWQSVTQGYMGISGIPPIGIGRFEITSDRAQLAFLTIMVALATWAAIRIRASRFGRALLAIAGSEDAARALGIDVARYKLAAFLVSSAYAALAGSLFVHVVGFVSPEVFGLHMVILAFTMLYVGGLGTIAGPIIGAVIVSLLPETFRAFKEYQDLAYGAGLILLLIYAPKGLASLGSLIQRDRKDSPLVIAGLVPAISIERAMPCLPKRDGRDKPGHDEGEALLALQRTTKRFGGLVAVDDVVLAVEPGGVFAVIGPNGAGKTTLFNLISGFQTPDAGRIVFNGRDITGLPPETIAASGLVRTFQLVQLFQNLTALENVKVGAHLHTSGGLLAALLRSKRTRAREAEVDAEAHRLLAFVGLGSCAEMSAGTLTYGQQRLLEIARALAATPKLLLLDEPAAGLNAEETKRLSATIRAIAAQGTTVLLIEHDMTLVMSTADRVAVLDFGRKIADGVPQHVRNDPAVVAAYLGATGDVHG